MDWPMCKRKIRDLPNYHERPLEAIEDTMVKSEAHKKKKDLCRTGNSYAKLTITSSVTDAVYQKIMDKNATHDAWKTLKQQCEILQNCIEFFSFTK